MLVGQPGRAYLPAYGVSVAAMLLLLCTIPSSDPWPTGRFQSAAEFLLNFEFHSLISLFYVISAPYCLPRLLVLPRLSG
jgi:hypothetical protein